MKTESVRQKAAKPRLYKLRLFDDAGNLFPDSQAAAVQGKGTDVLSVKKDVVEIPENE
jgi:hypothetical protein